MCRSACVFTLGSDYLEKYRCGNENNIKVILVFTIMYVAIWTQLSCCRVGRVSGYQEENLCTLNRRIY
jgi:hypothetical protein